MPQPHERLNEAMNRRRLELRMNWRQVSEAADVSYEGLRSIRRGDYRPTELTARGIDEALQWEPGSVLAILDGGDATPIKAHADRRAVSGQGESAQAADPSLSSRELDALADLIDVAAEKLGLTPEEAEEAFRRGRAKIERRRAAEQAQQESEGRRGRTG